MTGPGERVVYGAGPVRELIARRPTAVRAVWVDPHRAGRTTSDPVAAIVVAARAAGIRVEDRERRVLDQAAGPDARHQGVIAWLGPFAYTELSELVDAAGPAGGPCILRPDRGHRDASRAAEVTGPRRCNAFNDVATASTTQAEDQPRPARRAHKPCTTSLVHMPAVASGPLRQEGFHRRRCPRNDKTPRKDSCVESAVTTSWRDP